MSVKLDYENYVVAKKIAENNYASLMGQLPLNIQKKEEAIFEKITHSKKGRLKRLEMLYSDMDVMYDFIHKFTICKKGCSSCCHYEIAISDLEIEYIKSKVKTNKIKRNPDKKACPFLRNSICAIYQYRPFLCRRHLSLADSVKWCRAEICNDYKFPLICLSEVDKCYAYLLGPSGRDSIQDIRQAFHRG